MGNRHGYRPEYWGPLPYRVERIPYLQAKEFVTREHYAKGMANSTTGAFGLFEGRYLIGVLAFATPCSEPVRASVFGWEHVDRVTELHRLVILDVTPPNAESYFIARALALLKESKPHLWGVVSFADEGTGHYGTIYQATNALYYGTSRAKSQTFYLDGTGRLRHRRQCGVNVSRSGAAERGWTTVTRGPKHRYRFLIPDSRHHKKQLEGLCLLKGQDYPKKPVTMNGAVPTA